jgi:hypothetical protein
MLAPIMQSVGGMRHFTKARLAVLGVRAFSGQVKSGWRQENTLDHQSRAYPGRKTIIRICETRASRLGRHSENPPL